MALFSQLVSCFFWKSGLRLQYLGHAIHGHGAPGWLHPKREVVMRGFPLHTLLPCPTTTCVFLWVLHLIKKL